MSMYIHKLEGADFGYYKCVAINPLGIDEQFIELTGKCSYIAIFVSPFSHEQYHYTCVIIPAEKTHRLATSQQRDAVAAEQSRAASVITADPQKKSMKSKLVLGRSG